jgi:hypothetical protein
MSKGIQVVLTVQTKKDQSIPYTSDKPTMEANMKCLNSVLNNQCQRIELLSFLLVMLL